MVRSASKRAVSTGAGTAFAAVPALSHLSDVPSFLDLRVHEMQRAAYGRTRARLGEDAELACVVRLDRGFPALVTADALFRAEFAAKLTKGGDSRVAVGDWVVVCRPEGHEGGLIEEILPRTSAIARWRGKARGEKQVLAANVDTVIVVQALLADGFGPERIVRSAVIARDCGAEVAVVLTKADRVGAPARAAAVSGIRQLLGDEIAVAVTSSEAGAGIDGLRSLVPAGTIAILLGESGAGKSTLLNALLGHEALETGEVRARDDAGRHTTVARRMVALPHAGVIVDAPGLRSLPLVGHERGLAKVFPDIAEAASACRFRDCTHTHEPGCAVRGGGFSPRRIEAYAALASEMRANAASLDPDILL
ncbi:ribosome small subunit-dependent GTPase A [Coriobacteriales bacterium OH1046]|nr:ribosome small subunit-dependent GTPase A [Coriobacteriales bacterium OH1046]